jgi:hypothetical protein
VAIKDILRRVSTSEPEHDRSRLEEIGAARTEGTTQIGELEPRQLATVAGEIASLRVVPAKDGSAWLEATVEDGTGTLIVVWTGRKRIPGVRPGARLLATGRPLPAARTGRPTIYNPAYELLA